MARPFAPPTGVTFSLESSALPSCLFVAGFLQPQGGSEVVPGLPQRNEAMQRSLAALDPLVDGWDSEARSAAAGAQLQRLAQCWEQRGSGADGRLAGVFAADFSATAPELGVAYEDELFRIRRAKAGAPPVRLDREGFSGLCASPSAGAQALHVKLEVIHVEATEDGLVTQALYLGSGEHGGSARQVNGWWECRWREGSDPKVPPELAAVRVLGHEEIEARTTGGPLLSECSAAVFGGSGAWSEQLVPGLSDWRARLDARLGLPLLGHAAGLAVGDVDGDGLEDLYLCQPGGLPNQLFLHRSDGTVRDASAEAGVDFLDFSRAALLLDLDNDGDRDLAVDAAERLLLLANDGHGRFWLQAALAAPDATSLAAADVDLDGDLDLYVCACASPYDHSALPVPYHDASNGKPNVLFENRGDWIFVDATAARGLDQNNTRFSCAASFEDYDADGDPDLYVANDFGRNNLYRNDGGRFVDVAAQAGVEDISGGMGVTWGDCDGDGRFDLYVSNRYSSAGNRIAYQRRFLAAAAPEVRAQYQRHAHGNTLFRNLGDGSFADVSACQDPLGVSMGRRAWGALFADLDNDGWQDLLSPNGFLTETRNEDLSSFFWRQVVSRSPLDAAPEPDAAEAYRSAWSALNQLLRQGYSWSGREPNCAFLNLAGRGYANVSAVSGFDFPDDARALALVDWDGDGDQDLFTTNRTAPRVRFLRNDQASSRAHVTLELAGTRANRDAIGARVELFLADERGAERRLVRGVRAGEGYLAQSSSRLTVGLGSAGQRLTRVLVTWPGGEGEEFRGVEPGRAWRLVQGSGRAAPLSLPRAPPLAPLSTSVPPRAATARIVLVRPLPLPRLELVAADGNGLALFGIQAGGTGTGTGRAILLQLFSTTCAPCAAELADGAAHAAELERAGLALLALSVEPVAASARAGEFLAARRWPYPWATATPQTLEILDALTAALLDTEQRLALPASFLVDASGALRVVYLGPVTPDVARADRALCDVDEGALFDAASPFRGRWTFPDLPSDADFLEGRLRARGLEAAAAELGRGRLTVVRRPPADLLQEFGRRSVLEGRLAEAEKFFQRALAADPRHFGALFDWAVLLHRQERTAEAAELYGKALALDPEHADARFNLALARLVLGDRAGAELQLRWLKAHAAESAAALEKVLAGDAAK